MHCVSFERLAAERHVSIEVRLPHLLLFVASPQDAHKKN